MAGRLQQVRADPGPSLPAFARLGLPAAPAELAAAVDAHSRPGDIVVDLHGRGGWVARAAIGELRRSATFESDPLTRLLAEVVLRPPDVRHLDAAFQAIAGAPSGETTLRSAISQTYETTCATCGRTVVLDELIWDANQGPTRRHYRCLSCRDLPGHAEQRHAPATEADRARAVESEPYVAARQAIRDRLPTPPTRVRPAPEGADAAGTSALSPEDALIDQLLDLHTPRQLAGLAAILGRIEGELRAPSVAAALRLSLLHGLLPASRLNAYPGRMAALRIVGGRLRLPAGSQWRERNPWLAFEDGYRLVRGFVQQLEGGGDRSGPLARFGTDLRSLGEGMANVAVALATPEGFGGLAAEAELLRESNAGPRIRLVLGQPPLPWSPDRLAAAYHGTAWVLGRAAAALLPLDQVFGGPAPSRWDWQAASLRASLSAVGPALMPEGRALLLLGPTSSEGLIAAALGGVAAGFRLVEARSGSALEDDGDGVVSFLSPSAPRPSSARTRANVPLPPIDELDELEVSRPHRGDRSNGRAGEGGPLPAAEDRRSGDGERPTASGISGGEGSLSQREFARRTGEVITQTAVEILQARGEPASFDRLLGDILVGLDRAGQLRRLAARGSEPVTEREQSGAPLSLVEALLALIKAELGRPDNRRLEEAEPGQLWLASPNDRAAASAPLADRVEWAVFGLLSTAGRLSEAAFFERMAGMFRGHDQPDESLLRACLDSYRAPGTGSEILLARDTLQGRSEEHDELIARLAEMGHRLGLEVWIGRKPQGRRVRGRLLTDWLEEHERRAYLPLAGKSASDAVEDVDCIWYVRGRVTLLFEVEWTAMLGEPVLRRHARIATDDQVVRFLVVLPERVELVRYKLDRSPLLRRALEEGTWHILKADHLRTLEAKEAFTLADLEPYLGLDPPVERAAEQLPLFG